MGTYRPLVAAGGGCTRPLPAMGKLRHDPDPKPYTPSPLPGGPFPAPAPTLSPRTCPPMVPEHPQKGVTTAPYTPQGTGCRGLSSGTSLP